MKVFIVLASVLAIALAGNYPYHHYPLHVPVIGHTGVPLESAEIVHARQAHLAHVAAVKSQQGAYGGYHGGYHGGYLGEHAGYSGSHAYPIIGHNGIPLDTPEVQAAKAAHLAAYHKAAAAAAHSGGHYGHYRRRRGIFGLGHHGVPLETPEVQAAKAAHFAAHARAGGHHQPSAYTSGFGGYHYGGYHHAPLDHEGRVLDTPEVAALKAKHLEAHAVARSRVGAYGHGGAHYDGSYENDYEGDYEGGSHYIHGAASASHGRYHGPLHFPVIGQHGVPIDTPEVAAARQYHLKALAAASSRSYGHAGYHH